jgi:hypothetical protein
VLEVKRVKDLGLQALSSILNAKNPIERLSEIVLSFPTHAPLLSRKKVNKGLRDEVRVGVRVKSGVGLAGLRSGLGLVIERLSKIILSFPTHSLSLSQVMAYYQSRIQGSLPHNSLYVNGVPVSLGGATFNVFDFLTEVRTELKQMEKLSVLTQSSTVKIGKRAIKIWVRVRD